MKTAHTRSMMTSFRERLKSVHVSRVEISLLLILLIFGVPMIVLIPPGAGYDEEDHLVRVWELSALSFIPGQMSPQELRYPTVFRDFSYRQQGSAGLIDSEFWQRYSQASLDERGFVRRELDTKSIYSPALLLPQAIAMRLFGRSTNLPILAVFYLCRLAGLLSYLLLTWLAIRLIPFGKWILLVLAVSPMALFQAATLTPDTISNGIGFLFIAGCLRLTRSQEIAWKEVGGLFLLVFLLFLAKLNLIPLVLLPFLLIPPSRLLPRKLYVVLLAVTLGLFLLEVAGWNWIASRNIDSLLLAEANPTAQILHILGHPLAFLQTVLMDFLTNGSVYVQGWINGYGYYYWTAPKIVSVLFLLSLAAVTFIDSTSGQVNNKSRVIFILIFLAGYAVTITSLYTSFTPVGANQVFGVQGRYFVPLALLLFLVLSSFTWKHRLPALSPRWTLIFLITALSLNLLGILFSFHVPCGSTFYQTGLCYRPLFRDFPNEVRASQPVVKGQSITQEIKAACNGLAEVRVWISPSGTSTTGTTRFILENTSSQQILLDTSVTNDQLPAEDWYPLRFEPDWHSAGKKYILEILGFTDPGPQFLFTPQSEFDLGNSYENGQLREEDLVLQYGCATGLQKMWLTGKP